MTTTLEAPSATALKPSFLSFPHRDKRIEILLPFEHKAQITPNMRPSHKNLRLDLINAENNYCLFHLEPFSGTSDFSEVRAWGEMSFLGLADFMATLAFRNSNVATTSQGNVVFQEDSLDIVESDDYQINMLVSPSYLHPATEALRQRGYERRYHRQRKPLYSKE